jgi:hypothetical protein
MALNMEEAPNVPIIEEYEAMPDVKSVPTDLDKVAYAVAMAETHNCTLGYGKEYNNCFGIKNGNTAPCPEIGRNRMCIYERPEQSYEAFKKIWVKWYGGGLPTWAGAQKWTGNSNPSSWIKNVKYYYNQN